KRVTPARPGTPSGQTRAVGVGAAAAAGDFGARPGRLQAPIKTRQLVKTNRASGLTQRGKLQQPKRDPLATASPQRRFAALGRLYLLGVSNADQQRPRPQKSDQQHADGFDRRPDQPAAGTRPDADPADDSHEDEHVRKADAQ